jgi:hypothetical protein
MGRGNMESSCGDDWVSISVLDFSYGVMIQMRNCKSKYINLI